MWLNLAYAAALTAVSPLVLHRMIRHGRYRRGVGQKLLGLSSERAAEIRGDAERTIWLHAVSVGEVNLLPELVRRFEKQHPEIALAISSSTDTGYDLACKHFGDDRVFFCPLDFTWAVRRTLKNLRCEQLVLAELELWPNLIRCAQEANCSVHVINGRLSETSAGRYQQFAKILRPTFARLDAVGCQDTSAAERFMACGVSPANVTVTGSLKFDNAPRTRDTTEVNARINWSGIDPWHRAWCFGSTQTGEEAMALRVYDRLRSQHPELRLILVPRHVERFEEVAELIQSHGLSPIRRSRNDSQYADQWDSDEVILIDTIGELRHWWGVGQIATVGGSFGDRGGQNMLEPAGYGCAVSFGPNTKNFDTIAKQLIAAEAAIRVADEAELEQFVSRCLTDIPAADSLGQAARELVNQHRGAYQKTLEMLVPSKNARLQRAA
ncbi:Lipid IVA 3-deoxy-D-manno-octulosonic acid transferase [Rhodopirellula islandica]|uniref:3-deoxy-D-manno-octulosonic acid transferase n=1 Tax=Rhodopirellula islandica TaxID=595434 RepID=A0A0J1BH93_RHOIS|nr:3-deoxy-D-manno-octulosonic acid transferase [Rhodopirellula islandica]KLU05900.1 Lipid IVA 3-deoxy-D-manno-octulosonic acid transferase [Rhodopirellula islandica]